MVSFPSFKIAHNLVDADNLRGKVSLIHRRSNSTQARLLRNGIYLSITECVDAPPSRDIGGASAEHRLHLLAWSTREPALFFSRPAWAVPMGMMRCTL